MSHIVLARKYRPRTFDEVLGQDLIINTLKSALRKKRTAHAMLFTGSRGIGKTTIARLVAKSLVCEKPDDYNPCNQCSQCTSIDNFSSLDVVEIDGASHTGVDDIRDLRDSARYQPASAKYKIFIIDEVHMLSISAFNALLKILEEPPAHVIFIFATTESHKIPKTILSRCQRYDFKRVDEATILLALQTITQKEGYNFEEAGLKLIAQLADNSLRDALSLTEQIISDDKDLYKAEDIASLLGVVSHKVINDLCNHIIEKNLDSALIIARSIYESGLDLCHLMDGLAEKTRAMALAAHISVEKSHKLGIDQKTVDKAQSFNKVDLKRIFAMTLDAVPLVFQAKNPLYAVELFILRACERPPVGDAVSISNCLSKLDAIMHNKPLPQKKNLNESKPLNNFDKFQSLAKGLASTHPTMLAHLRHARPEFKDSTLVLNFEQELHYNQVNTFIPKLQSLELFLKIFGSIAIKAQLDQQQKPQTKTIAETDEENKKKEQSLLNKQAQEHPLVKKAIEIFGGNIEMVRKQ